MKLRSYTSDRITEIWLFDREVFQPSHIFKNERKEKKGDSTTPTSFSAREAKPINFNCMHQTIRS